jgi:hypothetical protein
MAAYRSYCFGPSDGIITVDVSEQVDDEAASRWGATLLARNEACRAVEVWELSRRVCRHQRGRAPAG